jgi:hypothetical protein
MLPHISFKRWLIPGILALGVLGFVVLNLLKPQPAVQSTAKPVPLVQVEAISPAAGGIRIHGSGLVKPQHDKQPWVLKSPQILLVRPSIKYVPQD